MRCRQPPDQLPDGGVLVLVSVDRLAELLVGDWLAGPGHAQEGPELELGEAVLGAGLHGPA